MGKLTIRVEQGKHRVDPLVKAISAAFIPDSQVNEHNRLVFGHKQRYRLCIHPNLSRAILCSEEILTFRRRRVDPRGDFGLVQCQIGLIDDRRGVPDIVKQKRWHLWRDTLWCDTLWRDALRPSPSSFYHRWKTAFDSETDWMSGTKDGLTTPGTWRDPDAVALMDTTRLDQYYSTLYPLWLLYMRRISHQPCIEQTLRCFRSNGSGAWTFRHERRSVNMISAMADALYN